MASRVGIPQPWGDPSSFHWIGITTVACNITQGRKPSNTRTRSGKQGSARNAALRCHHRGPILPYFQGGRGSLQGGPSLLSHGSGWGLQEIPIHPPAQLDLPHPNRSISCTLGTFSNGSPVSLSDWSQCFTNSEFKSSSSGGYVPWRLVVFTDALREGWTAGALLENFSPQVLPKSLPKPLSVVRVVDVLLKLSRNAAAPHNSAARAAVQSTRQPSTEPVPRPPPHQPAICC